MRLLVPLFLARLWWRGRNQTGYRAQLWRRLGWYGTAPASRPPKPIWIHAVSVGETLAIAPLIERLLSDRKDLSLLITSTTPTGAAQVRQRFGERVCSDWIPFDTPGAVRRFLRHWQPLAGVLVETEIWPNMVAQASANAIADGAAECSAVTAVCQRVCARVAHNPSNARTFLSDCRAGTR